MTRKTYARKGKKALKPNKKTDLATKDYVRKLVHRAPELKYHTIHMGTPTPPTPFNIGSLQIIHPLSGIINDSLSGDRVGDKIYVEYIDILHRFINYNDDYTAYVRLAVLIDKHPNKNPVTDVWKTETNVGNNAVSFVTGGKTDQIHSKFDDTRYQVLADRRFKLSPPIHDASNACEKWMKFRCPVKRTIKYIDGEGDNDLVATPCLYIVYFTEAINDAPTLTSALDHSYTYRVRYRDP